MTPENETQRVGSLRDFVAVLFRRKGIVIGVFLAALTVVAVLNASTPVFYESEARVLLSRGQQESAYSSRLRPLLSWEEELNSEIETVQSSQIVEMAGKILAERGAKTPDGRPLRLNPDHLKATTTGKSSVLYIRYRNLDPAVAREGARAVTQAYADFRQQVRAVPQVEKFFREEIESLRQQLEEWEQRRVEYLNEESVVQIPEERLSLIDIRAQSELELNRVRTRLAEEEAKVEVLRGELTREGGTLEPYPFSEVDNSDDQAVLELKKDLITERTNYYQAIAQYTDDHPVVQELRGRIELLEQGFREELESYIRHLQAKVEVFKAREEALLGSLQYADAELAAFPSKEARLASYDRIIDQLNTDYSALVDKQIQAKIERTGATDWNVLILQPAGPAQPLRMLDRVRLALIPALSLLVGIALAFLIDGLDHSLKDATEVETHLGVPVLGSVGKLR